METYLSGALEDIEARVKFLKGRVRPGPGRSNATLVRSCRERLDVAASMARSLRQDRDWLQSGAAPARFRAFRTLVGELDELEYVAVQVLVRWSDDDARANELVERIASEISYPLPAPVVACQSREYYRVYPDLGLLLIPPAEGAFLLHLPDLYHELAHPLLTEFNDPKIEPLQKAFVVLWSETQSLVHDEVLREKTRRLTPQSFRLYLEGWKRSWRSWLTEFLCDAFAAHTLGPAFAWAHFHLTAKRGRDPFKVPLGEISSHPADAARLDTIVEVLRLNGRQVEADEVVTKWQAMLRLGGYTRTPEYERCFPSNLLKRIAITSSRAITQIGCAAADEKTPPQIGGTLNSAWTEFWRNPSAYSAWQQANVGALGLATK